MATFVFVLDSFVPAPDCYGSYPYGLYLSNKFVYVCAAFWIWLRRYNCTQVCWFLNFLTQVLVHIHTLTYTHTPCIHTQTQTHADTQTHGHKDMGIARVVVIDGFPLTLITTLSQKSWSCGMGSKVPTPRYWLGLFPSSSSWLANLGRDLFNWTNRLLFSHFHLEQQCAQ